MASWLVLSSSDRAVRFPALAGDIVQHILLFELPIIVNRKVPLNLPLSLIYNTVSLDISEENKFKKRIILFGLDLNPELPGASRTGYLPLDH